MKANELQINNFLQAPNVQFVIRSSRFAIGKPDHRIFNPTTLLFFEITL
jgi:hypothetical protein